MTSLDPERKDIGGRRATQNSVRIHMRSNKGLNLNIFQDIFVGRNLLYLMPTPCVE